MRGSSQRTGKRYFGRRKVVRWPPGVAEKNKTFTVKNWNQYMTWALSDTKRAGAFEGMIQRMRKMMRMDYLGRVEELQKQDTLNVYQVRAAQYAQYENPMYPIMSLMAEAAEFADPFIKRDLRGDNKEIARKDIVSEAGDILWNLANALHDQGITLQEAADYNLEKLASRQKRGVIRGDGGDR